MTQGADWARAAFLVGRACDGLAQTSLAVEVARRAIAVEDEPIGHDEIFIIGWQSAQIESGVRNLIEILRHSLDPHWAQRFSLTVEHFHSQIGPLSGQPGAILHELAEHLQKLELLLDECYRSLRQQAIADLGQGLAVTDADIKSLLDRDFPSSSE